MDAENRRSSRRIYVYTHTRAILMLFYYSLGGGGGTTGVRFTRDIIINTVSPRIRLRRTRITREIYIYVIYVRVMYTIYSRVPLCYRFARTGFERRPVRCAYVYATNVNTNA